MKEIVIKKELFGTILDVGGGGEGVIGRVYGSQVTAIDNRKEELDEAPCCCQKLLMDATDLAFAGETFDNVTFFYSLMYMDRETQEQALAQAARVLKPGGKLVLWDTAMGSAYPEPFLAELTIVLPNETLHTTYGVVKEDGAQDRGRFTALCQKRGLELTKTEENGPDFRLDFRKR